MKKIYSYEIYYLDMQTGERKSSTGSVKAENKKDAIKNLVEDFGGEDVVQNVVVREK